MEPWICSVFGAKSGIFFLGGFCKARTRKDSTEGVSIEKNPTMYSFETHSTSPKHFWPSSKNLYQVKTCLKKMPTLPWSKVQSSMPSPSRWTNPKMEALPLPPTWWKTGQGENSQLLFSWFSILKQGRCCETHINSASSRTLWNGSRVTFISGWR